MEQNSPLFGLTVESNTRDHLYETARWGRFLSIVGFVLCGLFVVGGVAIGGIMRRFSAVDSDFETSGAYNAGYTIGMILVYILFALLYFFPCLYLFRFSNRMRVALNGNTQDDLDNAFYNLKRMFRFVGILTAVLMAIYGLVIVIALLGMAMRG